MRKKRWTLLLTLVIPVIGLLALAWLLGNAPAPAAAQASQSTPVTRWPSDEWIRYVAPTGVDTGDCSASSNPCRTIQYAVNRSLPEGEIRVAAGRYTDIHTRYGMTHVVLITQPLAIRGGYTTTNWTSPDPEAHPTIIDAQGQGRGAVIGDSLGWVTLEGLHITGGDAAGLGGWEEAPELDAGGGLYIKLSNITISRCQIYSNTAHAGGGIYFAESMGLIANSEVTSNTAEWGGGLLAEYNDVVIRDNVLQGNVATEYGGAALSFENTDFVFEGNQVLHNQATYAGGLEIFGSHTTVRNNTFRGNVATEENGAVSYALSTGEFANNSVISNTAAIGGGMGLYSVEADLQFRNNLFAHNRATHLYGSAVLVGFNSSFSAWHTTFVGDGACSTVYLTETASAALTNTVLVSGAVGIHTEPGTTATLEATLWGAGAWANAFYDTWGNGTVSTGTINYWADPGFVDPANEDYHITETSAAVDAGVSGPVVSDVDGDARPAAFGPDLGFDEIPGPVLQIDKSAWPSSLDPDDLLPYPLLNPGDLITYTLVVTSAGAETTHNVWLTDTLPPTQRGVTVTSSRGSCTTGTTWGSDTTCDLGTMVPGDIAVVTLTTQVTPTAPPRAQLPYPMHNAAQVTSDDTDQVATSTQTMLQDCHVRLNDSPLPYESVQAAVDASTHPTDVVRVAGYCLGAEVRGGLTQTVHLEKDLTLQGGWNISFTQRNVLSYPTELDAYGLGRVIYAEGSISATIEGFRLTGGDATGAGGGRSGEDAGGGLYVDGGATTIRDSHIFENDAAVGGGLYLSGDAVHLTSNRVTSNTATVDGAGLYIDYGAAILEGNGVTANSATENGGGIHIYRGNHTLVSNTVTANTARDGGGVYVYYDTSVLTSNVVTGNDATTYGGGIYLSSSDALLSENIFAANSASHGGGGHLRYGHPVFIDNVVIDNVGSYGGGLYLYRSDQAVVDNNDLSSNAATHGGAVYLSESDMALNNNIVANNEASSGSGLYIFRSSPQLVHTTIAQNHEAGGEGVFVDGYSSDPSHVSLVNTILVSHTVGVYVDEYSEATLEGTLWGDGSWSNQTDTEGLGTILVGSINLWADPGFVDPDGGDYHILPGSAAMDAGLDAGVATDIDGDARPMGLAPDLGADEVPVRLKVTKSAMPDPVAAGAPLTYRLTVTNTGHLTLTAMITDHLPAQVTPGGVLTWSPTIAAPDGIWTETVVVTVVAGYSGPLTNVVEVAAAGGASGVHTTTVTAQVPVAGLSAFNDSPTALGQPTTLTATLAQGSDVTFGWAFGNGEVGSGSVVSHTYSSGDVYTAVVTAANSVSTISATTGVSIDAATPETTIIVHPPDPSASPDAAFEFSGDDGTGSGVASFECQLDGNGWSHCTSPREYVGLSDGPHTFEARATDNVGNTDATPAAYTWDVDTTPPSVPTLVSPADGTVTSTDELTLTWTASAGAAGYLLDFNGAITDVGNVTQHPTGVLTDSVYTWTVATYDALSNTSAYAAAWEFQVDTLRTCWVRLNDDPTDYATVQAAVDASTQTTDVVKVAGYCAGVQVRAALSQVVYISKTVTVRGGYTSTNWTTPDPDANPTTLDARGEGRGVYITGDIMPTVEGLRLTGGDATGLGGGVNGFEDAGGGVYIDQAMATINSCIILSNTASTIDLGFGGGLYLRYSNAILMSNSVKSNTASSAAGGQGGGLYLRHGNATLIGNSVEGNIASTAAIGSGGGIYLSYNDSSLEDNVVAYNTASTADHGYGGGLRLYQSDATLERNTVISNTASTAAYSGYGGGLRLDSGDAILISNIIAHNTASTSHNGLGGGLYLYQSSATLENNLVQDNTASITSYYGYGGGLYLYLSNATIEGNTVISNTAGTVAGLGGGLHVYRSNNFTLTNNLVVSNRATGGSGLFARGDSSYSTSGRLFHNTIANNHGGGQGVYAADYTTLAFTNTIIAGHSVGINVTTGSTITLESTLWHNNGTDSAGSGMIITGTVNIYGDPAFVDPAGGDYHLLPGSAAIDAGVESSVDHDVDSDPRPMGLAPDLGFDEVPIALDVIHTATPDPVAAGSPLTYHLAITNTGHVSLTATITDHLPAHVLPGGVLTWTPTITAPGGVWSEIVVVTVAVDYSGPLTNAIEVTTAEGASGVHTTTVAAQVPVAGLSAVNDSPTALGQSTTLTATLDQGNDAAFVWAFGDGELGSSSVVSHTYASGGTYTAVVTAANPVGTISATTMVTVVLPPPDLAIAKSGPSAATAGDSITYTLTVTNAGAGDATDLLITDTLPTGAYHATGGALHNGVVSWTLPLLEAGHHASVQLVVTATETITNADYGVRASGGYSATGEIPVATVVTAACEPVSGVQLGRTPTGELFVGNTVRFSAQAGGTIPFTYTWTLNGAPVGGNRATFERTFDTAGPYTVSVSVANACGVGSDSTTVTVQNPVVEQPDLSPSYKSVNLTSVEEGDVLSYTLVLRNTSAVSASATLTDPIPSYTAYVAGSAQASDGGPVTLADDQLHWSGRVISGTPIVIQFATQVLSAPVGTTIRNTALVDDGLGNLLELEASSIYNPGYLLTINEGDLYTNIPTVTLRFAWNADDGISFVKISNDGGFSSEGDTTAWLPVDPADPTYTDWILSTYGSLVLPRTVYVKFRNAAGHQFGPIQDDIIYDPTAPAVTVEIVPEVRASRGQAVTLRVTASDDNSGVSQIQVSDDPDFGTFSAYAYAGVSLDIPWTLQPSGEVYVRAVDRASNVTQVQETEEQFIYLPLVLRADT